jgi:EAL domain-containing protein (putative c-di-GMP-specific phosphodiesterase class I)
MNAAIQDNCLTEDSVDFAREMLFFLGNGARSTSCQAQSLLEKLTDEIFSLREKSISFEAIAMTLQQCGTNVNATAVRDYYFHILDLRVKSCEREISSHYRPEWNDLVERAGMIERDLRESLRTGNGLILHYQPQVDMNTGAVQGAEALVRWQFNGSLIHPGDFIPVAERSGLIVPIGDWVLREACHEAKRWQEAGLGGGMGIKMGVNLSVKQFSKSLPNTIHEILLDTNLPTHLLGLEITESFLVGNDSLDMLHALRESGIHLSIDDFGTGYSCLANLKDMPIDTIKIDRAFVRGLGIEAKSRSVTEMIVGLANKLGASTLAEGVETDMQEDILKDLGCSVCQGFLYSKPLPSEDFIRYAVEH